MAQDTLADLRTAVRDNLREPDGTPGQYWTDSKVTRAINSALSKMEDIALQHGPWFLEYAATQNIVSGTYSYAFPSVGTGLALRRVRELAVFLPGDDTTYPPRPLKELSLLQGHQYITAPLRDTGNPAVFWFTDASTVSIYPKPNFSLTAGLVWQVYRSLAVLATGTDTMPMPDLNAYSDLIIFDATMHLMMQDEEIPVGRFQAFKMIRDERITEYIAFLTKGRRTSPKSIRVM